MPREDAFLAGKWAMVSVLRHRHMGEQPSAGVAAQQGRGLCLGGADRAATGLVLAPVLQPRMLQHFQLRRRVLQRLAQFLADAHHACEAGLVRIAQVMFDATTRQVRIDGRSPLTATPVTLDLVELFGWHRNLDGVLPEFGLQHRERFAARAEHAALELGQLRGQRRHLRVRLVLERLEGLCGLHEQILEHIDIVGQTCAIDGGGQQLHGGA
jgi:hypothetical protein